MFGIVVGIIGMAIVGRERFARIPYGPYIAVAATLWVFLPAEMRDQVQQMISMFNPFASSTPF